MRAQTTRWDGAALPSGDYVYSELEAGRVGDYIDLGGGMCGDDAGSDATSGSIDSKDSPDGDQHAHAIEEGGTRYWVGLGARGRDPTKVKP